MQSRLSLASLGLAEVQLALTAAVAGAVQPQVPLLELQR
jgi:hypothetical protein